MLHPQLDDLLELRHQAKALGLSSYHLVNSVLTGLYASVFRGQGLDFEEVREYEEGDDIRNMDWKITARTGVAHLKVFREERERTVMLCVDQGPHMSFGTRGTFKSIQAARAAALLGWSASHHHDQVGAVLFGDSEAGLQYFPPTRSRRSLWRMLRTLTRAPVTGSTAGEPLGDALMRMTRGVAKGSLIFVIAAIDREVKPLEYRFAALCQHHDLVLLPIDDQADWDIPPMGQVTFRAPEGHVLELDTDGEEGRLAFQTAWETRRQSLIEMANRLGIVLFPLRTDEDVHISLLKAMRKQARAKPLH